jgi:hypothetical protein
MLAHEIGAPFANGEPGRLSAIANVTIRLVAKNKSPASRPGSGLYAELFGNLGLCAYARGHDVHLVAPLGAWSPSSIFDDPQSIVQDGPRVVSRWHAVSGRWIAMRAPFCTSGSMLLAREGIKTFPRALSICGLSYSRLRLSTAFSASKVVATANQKSGQSRRRPREAWGSNQHHGW